MNHHGSDGIPLVKTVLLPAALFLLYILLFNGCAHHNHARTASPETETVLPASDQEIQYSRSEETVPDTEAADQEISDNDDDYLYEDDEEREVHIADPLSLLNRGVFNVNDKIYFWILKPVAQGYAIIVPEQGRICVSNIFQNISAPVRFVNNLLQIKMKFAGTELARFALNSTLGLAGCFDVAKDSLDLKERDEDLGQTLGHYRAGHGFYIVWPLLGPSSIRDTVGFIGDRFVNPLSYISPSEAALGLKAYDIINSTSLRIGDYEAFKEAAIDPYLSLRNAYIQNRSKKVKE
jgi:phospholipid-binding lipoprotein MlaA